MLTILKAKERAVVTANAKSKGKGIATSSDKRTVSTSCQVVLRCS